MIRTECMFFFICYKEITIMHAIRLTFRNIELFRRALPLLLRTVNYVTDTHKYSWFWRHIHAFLRRFGWMWAGFLNLSWGVKYDNHSASSVLCVNLNLNSPGSGDIYYGEDNSLLCFSEWQTCIEAFSKTGIDPVELFDLEINVTL